jgi:hypothetical protein
MAAVQTFFLKTTPPLKRLLLLIQGGELCLPCVTAGLISSNQDTANLLEACAGMRYSGGN